MYLPGLNVLLLKKIREAGGIRQLAQLTGIDYRSLQKMMKTERIITVEVLLKLLVWLGEEDLLFPIAMVALKQTGTLCLAEKPKTSLAHRCLRHMKNFMRL